MKVESDPDKKVDNQEDIGFAKENRLDEDDINGDKARMEYMAEKYSL